MNEESNRGFDGPDEPACSGGAGDDPWDEWDEFAVGFSDEHVWNAFELDDWLEEPEPEYGDFWAETDDEEEAAE